MCWSNFIGGETLAQGTPIGKHLRTSCIFSEYCSLIKTDMWMSNCRTSNKSLRILGVRDFLFDRNSPRKNVLIENFYCFNFGFVENRAE